MKLLKFCQTLEERIQEEIEEAYPSNWDEDYISRRLIVAVKSMSHIQVEYLTSFINIYIAAFKQKGENESKYGDIAFVLNINYKDGDVLQGVGFLEAKRVYRQNHEYTAIKFDQLKRIYQNAPSSRLMLYNFKYISNLAATGLDGSKGTTSGILPKIPSTYTSVLPMSLALHLQSKKDNLEKYSIPFSYQLAYRYFFGMELEFSEDLVKQILGNAGNIEELPSYVVVIHADHVKRGDLINKDLFRPIINRDVFAEITDISKFEK